MVKRKAFLGHGVLLAFGLATLAGCTPSDNSEGEKGGGGNTKPTSLVFGFVPSVEADKIAEDAKPMCDFLSKELGIEVKSITTNDYTGLIEAMKSGNADIGSLPTLAYVLAKDQGGAEVVLKTSRKNSVTYRAMFIARADSGIAKIEDAKGKRLAFTDTNSTSGYLYPMAYLKKQNIDPQNFFSQMVSLGAHDAAVRAVYDKQVDVACVYDDARNKLEKLDAYKDVKEKVVKIGDAGEIPNDTISLRPSLDPELKKKIKDALLKYVATEEGKKTLLETYEVDDLVDAQDSDYDSVREVAKSMGVSLDNWAQAEAEKKKQKEASKTAPTPAAPAPEPKKP